MDLALETRKPSEAKADVLVLGRYAADGRPPAEFGAVDRALGGLLSKVLASEKFEGKPGQLSYVHTGGKIPTILDDIKPEEVMFLINAIYFKGTWQYQFDPKATSPSSFHAADGTVQTVPFMNRPENMKPKFRAGGTQQLAIAELPYGNGAFAMDIVMAGFGQTASIDSISNRVVGSLSAKNLTSSR